ncbi:DNA-3-methyladenine glycosylase [Candidatus Saccharibacteria bacterium]|nr:DNA-3-methyladenine glycosylase [Candidatus Saccharibacteria bacterium]
MIQSGIAHLQKVDPILASVIAAYPEPRISPHTQYYQELVESIISQQLSIKAADAIVSRFKALFEGTFPEPSAILTKDVETYRSIGLSRQKASYIRDLASKVLDGTVQFDHLEQLSNQGIIAELTQIKGVGEWTVHMFLIFCMGRLDVLPVGDLGIRNGIQRLYGLAERPSTEEVAEISGQRGWSPYESIASWYIWQSLDNKPIMN